MAESNGSLVTGYWCLTSLTAGWMIYSHLRADCLYTRHQLRTQRSVTSMGSFYIDMYVLLTVKTGCQYLKFSCQVQVYSCKQALQSTNTSTAREMTVTYWTDISFRSIGVTPCLTYRLATVKRCGLAQFRGDVPSGVEQTSAPSSQ